MALPHPLIFPEIDINDRPVTVTKVEQLDAQREGLFRLEVESTIDLPRTIIVKQHTQSDVLNHEKEAYNRLQDLQGIVIPQFLGEGSFNGVPALFLLEIVGSTLYDLARNKDSAVELNDIELQLEKSLEALTMRGAVYWDQRLDNFLFCNNAKIMIIDLEDVTFPENPTDRERGINFAGVRYLISRFRDTREPNRPPSPVKLWSACAKDDNASANSAPAMALPSVSSSLSIALAVTITTVIILTAWKASRSTNT